MKGLGITGFVVSILATLMGVYLYFVVVPAAESANAAWELAISMGGDDYFGSAQHRMNMSIMEFKTDFGAIVMLSGFLAFVLSIFPAIKKVKIAWVGVILGLLAGFIGAAYGTHMFS